MKVRRFSIRVPEEVLVDLKVRLDGTRLPPDFSVENAPSEFTRQARPDWVENKPLRTDWSYGMDQRFLSKLLEYWRNEYDWRKQEHELNRFNHYKITVSGGSDLHFIHERSEIPDAIPLLLLHGWPGSVYEFTKMIPMLVNPEDGKQGFHVIAPSLPGYAWSDPCPEPGMDAERMAMAIHEMMLGIGYNEYVVQGGDWGSLVANQIALSYPRNCVALHQNLNLLSVSAKGLSLLRKAMTVGTMAANFLFPSMTLNEREAVAIANFKELVRTGIAYFQVHSSRPQTLAWTLHDSPIGLCAWIVEKLHYWVDHSGDVTSVLSMDEIITEVMIYWVTNCISSSTRMYYECFPFGQDLALQKLSYCHAPTGIALFKGEPYQFPSKLSSFGHNLLQVSYFDKGGHFAAWEQPALLASDIRKFFHETTTFEDCVHRARTFPFHEKPFDLHLIPLPLLLGAGATSAYVLRRLLGSTARL